MRKRITPKKYHFLPRTYLEGFCVNSEMLYVYDKKREIYWKQKPSEIAFEKDFYLVKDENGLNNLNYEDALERIESCFPSLKEKLQDYELLDFNQKEELAFFICLQMVRTPYFRDFYTDLNNQLYRKSLKKILFDPAKVKEKFDRFLGEEIPLSEYELFISKVQSESISLNFSKHELVHFTLTIALELYPILIQMKWEIHHAINGAFFITSDNPVIQDIPISPYNKMPRAFLNPGSAKIFPLSKEMCFIAYGKSDSQIHNNIDSDLVNDVNIRVAANSNRFIYGNDLDYINSLVKKIKKDGFDLKFYPHTY